MALQWLKENNSRYYGLINISSARLEQLPEDDVPMEIMSIVRQTDESNISEIRLFEENNSADTSIPLVSTFNEGEEFFVCKLSQKKI